MKVWSEKLLMSDLFPVIEVPEDATQATETGGTRSKLWFDRPKLGVCLYKQAFPNANEDWSEKIASELCNLLRLPHAHYQLARWNDRRGTISPSFLPKGGTLILGNEILARTIPDYPQSQYRNLSQHTLDAVLTAMENDGIYPPFNWNPPAGIATALDTFLGYLLLDAYIGNSDRHHENWGFIEIRQETSTLAATTVYLAPTYDHASSLGRELLDEGRQRKSVSAYAKRCRSALYADVSDKKPLKTFDAFRGAARYSPHAALAWLDLLSEVSAADTKALFDRVPKDIISEIAIEFAVQILEINKNRLLNLQEELS